MKSIAQMLKEDKKKKDLEKLKEERLEKLRDLEKRLQECKTKEEVFGIFQDRVMSKIGKRESAHDGYNNPLYREQYTYREETREEQYKYRKETIEETFKFAKYFLKLESGKDIEYASFGCGCYKLDYLIKGESGDHIIESLDSVEARILSMFGNGGGGCDGDGGYVKKYYDFMSANCIQKYSKLYIALAISGLGEIFESYNVEIKSDGCYLYTVKNKVKDIVALEIYKGILTDTINLDEEKKSQFKSEMKNVFGQNYDAAVESLRNGLDKYNEFLGNTLLDSKKVKAKVVQVFEKVFS
ncbi:MAG: hypothetical protein Q7J54_07715 [Candidatus Woesearchaeota archaeon]|nr:hypothetical protein [Candidatus Woesearchaeota archaeon]